MQTGSFPYRQPFWDYLLIERGLSEGTAAGYCLDLVLFFQYLLQNYNLKEPLEVEAFHVRGFLSYLMSERNNIARTRNHKLSSLRSYFYFLEKAGYLQGDNPVQGFKNVKTPRPLPVYLTSEEASALIEAAEKSRSHLRDVAMIRFFLQTGCRLNELLQLETSRLNLKDKTALLSGKGSKERLVPLSAKTIQALESYLNKRQPAEPAETRVFLNNRGAPISRRGVQKLFERTCQRAGLNRPHLSVHKLRHTCLTLLLHEGVDLATLKELAGHDHINSTEIYVHVNHKRIRQAIDKHPLG